MKNITLSFLIILILSGLACSGSESGLTVSPAPDMVITGQSSGQSHELWGHWQVSIDTSTGTVETIPIREAVFHANVVMYLQSPYPNGLGIVINDMNLTTGNFDIDVSLTHPFDDPSLTGFDVKGIFISNGLLASGFDSSLTYSDNILNPRLLNADGYTRWWNQKEFTTSGILGYTEGILGTPFQNLTNTLNPFKYFADHLDTADEFILPDGGRNHFSNGETNTRKYLLNFPVLFGNPIIIFNYAVDACWEEPDGDPTDLANFPPEANQPEAYQITVADMGSDAWFHEPSGLNGGSLKLRIGVHDYGLATASTVAEELAALVLESPTLFPGQIPLYEADVVSWTGDCIQFYVEIDNVTPESVDYQHVLLHAAAPDLTYDQDFGTAAPDKPLTAYMIHTIDVSDEIPPPNPPVISDVLINRDGNGKLDGFTIELVPDPVAQQWLIYWSDDPYEVNGTMTFEVADNGVITEPTWTYSIDPSESNDQWMLYAATRSFIDDPESESDPSVYILIDFAAFDNIVENNDNKWRIRTYQGTGTYNNFEIAANSGDGIDTSGSLVLLPKAPPSKYLTKHSTTYCVTPELPNINGASHSFLEMYHRRTEDFPEIDDANYPGDFPYGYSIASTPEILNPDSFKVNLPYGQIWDFNVDLVSESDWLDGNHMNYLDIEGLHYRYNSGDEAGDPSNGWSGAWTDFVFSKYEIPAVYESNHRFAGVCWGGKQFPLSGSSYDVLPVYPDEYPLIIDEVAFVVY